MDHFMLWMTSSPPFHPQASTRRWFVLRKPTFPPTGLHSSVVSLTQAHPFTHRPPLVDGLSYTSPLPHPQASTRQWLVLSKPTFPPTGLHSSVVCLTQAHPFTHRPPLVDGLSYASPLPHPQANPPTQSNSSPTTQGTVRRWLALHFTYNNKIMPCTGFGVQATTP
eukprot:1153420-Pelagomonas_calceolata.AAC.4